MSLTYLNIDLREQNNFSCSQELIAAICQNLQAEGFECLADEFMVSITDNTSAKGVLAAVEKYVELELPGGAEVRKADDYRDLCFDPTGTEYGVVLHDCLYRFATCEDPHAEFTKSHNTQHTFYYDDAPDHRGVGVFFMHYEEKLRVELMMKQKSIMRGDVYHDIGRDEITVQGKSIVIRKWVNETFFKITILPPKA